MKLLIDTNIIIDYLADRAPFAAYAEKVIDLCATGEAEGMLTANSATDIYYIIRKVAGRDAALRHMKALFDVLGITDVGRGDILHAMEMDMQDFEDALAAVCAKRASADFIVTRDGKGFKDAPVPSISPTDLLRRFFPYMIDA